jgi:hypothetical protein
MVLLSLPARPLPVQALKALLRRGVDRALIAGWQRAGGLPAVVDVPAVRADVLLAVIKFGTAATKPEERHWFQGHASRGPH